MPRVVGVRDDCGLWIADCGLNATTNGRIPPSSLTTRHSPLATPASNPQSPIHNPQFFSPFSPLLGFLPAAPADCLLFDISATSAWFGGEEKLLAELVALVERSGEHCRIAVADSPSAAWAVSYYGPSVLNHVGRSPLSTERATLWCVPRDAPQTLLSRLPVEALRLDPKVLAWLHELGLRQLAQLQPFSRTQLVERFGTELLRRWDQLWGTWPEELVPWHEPSEFTTRLDFDFSTTHYETLLHVLEQQLARLVQPLVERQQGVQRVECVLRGESGSLVPLQVALLRPTVQVAYLLELFKLRLESQPLVEPVTGIQLTATAVMPIERRQQTLFATEQHEDDGWLWASLVERLCGRLGDGAVLRARRRSEHQPEYAWSESPWGADSTVLTRPLSRRPGQVVRSGPPASSLVATRPLHLERRPIAIRMVSLQPQRVPQRFWWREQAYDIERHWGPERIETGWWRGRDVRRDYYRVETTSGQWFWVFRRLHDGAWFLQGWFE